MTKKPDRTRPVRAAVTLPSSSVQNEFGRILDQVRDQDIIVTRHDVPRAVLVSAERYNELVRRETAVLETLQAQFDALYARMQLPEVQAGMAQGFRATPSEMGRAALAAAQRDGKTRNVRRRSEAAASDQAIDTRTARRKTGGR